MAPIETNFGPLTATMNCVVTDPAGLTPQNIIRTSDQWRVNVKWEIDGMLVAMLSGNWRLNLYMESLGPQPEFVLYSTDIPFASGVVAPFKLTYDITRNFGPNNPAQEGVYRLVAVLTSVTPIGTPGPFAGYDAGPLLQFYVAP